MGKSSGGGFFRALDLFYNELATQVIKQNIGKRKPVLLDVKQYIKLLLLLGYVHYLNLCVKSSVYLALHLGFHNKFGISTQLLMYNQMNPSIHEWEIP